MILNEKDYVNGLKQWAGNKLGAAKDMALATGGSQRAEGRLNIRAATEKLIRDWKQFCGQRSQAGVNGFDAYDPTLNQIALFLKLSYNVNIDLGEIETVADAAEEADVEEGPPADLKATTPDEYENLKKMASGDNVRANPAAKSGGKVRPADANKDRLKSAMNDEIANDKANGLPTKESVNEAALFEDGNALRKLFGTIAVHLWDAGLLSVERGTKGRTVSDITGKRAKGSGSGIEGNAENVADYDEGTTVDTAVDDNGNYIDAILLRNRLIDMKVDGVMISRLQKELRSGGDLKTVFMGADDQARVEMVSIAAAMVRSLKKAKATMMAGQNVTSDGNTLNFNQFKKYAEHYKVGKGGFPRAISALNKALADDGEIDIKEVESMMTRADDTGRAILGIMAATVLSIQKVTKNAKKDDEPEAEKVE